MCVLLLQDLLQSCSREGRRRVEVMCYERRRAEACVDGRVCSSRTGTREEPVIGRDADIGVFDPIVRHVFDPSEQLTEQN